jgi:hypothetical protein
MSPIVAPPRLEAGGGSYETALLSERFDQGEGGLEQSFSLRRRPSGSGELRIVVPLTGISVAGQGSTLEVLGEDHRVLGHYSGLQVSDATGRTLDSSMRASRHGSAIEIELDDAGAGYPIEVDPTWSEVAALSAPSPQTNASFGWSVAISGQNVPYCMASAPIACASTSRLARTATT